MNIRTVNQMVCFFSKIFHLQLFCLPFIHNVFFAGIVSYMEGQVGLSSKIKPTIREVKEFLKQAIDDVVVLGLFKDEEDPLFKTFIEANNDIREEYFFGHTFDKNAKDFLGVKESSVLVVHPPHFISEHEPKHHAFRVNIFEGIFMIF